MNPAKRPIVDEDHEWSPDHELRLPIDAQDLPDFGHWVNWNGYHYGNPTGPHEQQIGDILHAKGGPHFAYDFAAYFNQKMRSIILGLPPKLPIRAIADGFVVDILDASYLTSITLAHSEKMPNDLRERLTSDYGHVVPVDGLAFGDRVKTGEVFAHLFADEVPEEGTDKFARLVHLHFNLFDSDNSRRLNPPDPVNIFGADLLSKQKGAPQGCSHFTVDQQINVPVFIANYRKLIINGFEVKNANPFVYG